MPNINFPGKRELSRYDEMGDAQLQQLLREDASKPEGEGMDVEAVLYVTQLLAKRRAKQGQGVSARQALQRFQQHYDPENDGADQSAAETWKDPGCGSWRHFLAPIAAALALVVCCTLGGKALGTDIWKVVPHWAQEDVYFNGGEDGTQPSEPWEPGSKTYDNLSQALRENGISAAMVPSWVPEDFAFYDAYIDYTPYTRYFSIAYKGERGMLSFNIKDYRHAGRGLYQQGGGCAEIYEVSGVPYFIFYNNARAFAVWLQDGMECSISGPVSIQEMKQIIDSIGKG